MKSSPAVASAFIKNYLYPIENRRNEIASIYSQIGTFSRLVISVQLFEQNVDSSRCLFFFDLTSRYRLEFQPSVLTLEKNIPRPVAKNDFARYRKLKS